jgi:2-oxoglutarate dehydrogenase E1 component
MSGRVDFILRANADYIEDQHRRWLENPRSVPEDWALFFTGIEFGERRPPAAGGSDSAFALVHAYREFGHLVARLDPLGGDAAGTHPFLELAAFGLGEADLDREVQAPFHGDFRGTLRHLIEALRETYCGTLGAEFMDIPDAQQREWLQARLESTRSQPQLGAASRVQILRSLLGADGFEQFLHARYTGQKRFSLEGAASLIPMFETLVSGAAAMGVEQLTIGMPHRGRINFLANIMKKPLDNIFSEFESAFTPPDPEVQGHDDVKYHLGYSSDHDTPDGRRIHLSLTYNPSHLEFVNPVVLGAMRARQEMMADRVRERGIPVLIHGDAAFSGEGIVPETLALAQLPAYESGGTIHIVVNNQVGFTTSPHDARVTRYPSAIMRIVDAPVLHVNGDDPEACVHAMTLALEYRMRFKRDVCIDLVCYRKHGHNEMDDPTFTQPVMYRDIAAHVPAARQYADRLVHAGVLDAGEVERMEKSLEVTFRAAHRRASSEPVAPVRHEPRGTWRGLAWAGDDWSADTRAPRETLEQVLHGVTRLPDDFHPHRKIAQLSADRRRMFLEDRVDWSLGEALAYGTLLLEGRSVRLTGQDSGRGTFTHRHAALFDSQDGRRWVPLQHLVPEQGRFEVVDTMLSEAAVLGFEYGFSTADPHTLVVWEAQFGDFANVAQVAIDQFIASGEAKWGRMSGITLLLPHGYEGQGPEHSSGRLERFLALCADKNLQVCNLTTPAQLFHALRRQLHRQFRKPLVIMSPKSLLRHKLAVSPVAEFTGGTFRSVLDDTLADPQRVRRIRLTTGKLHYTLREAREARSITDTALVRVEQLYPFPAAELAAVFAAYPHAHDVGWIQEEPANMGAWRNLRHRLEAVVPAGHTLRFVARRSAASPATGFYATHQQQEEALVEAALGEAAAPADGSNGVSVAQAEIRREAAS